MVITVHTLGFGSDHPAVLGVDRGRRLDELAAEEHSWVKEVPQCYGFTTGRRWCGCFTLEHCGLRHTFTVDTGAVAVVTFWTAAARPLSISQERGH